MKTLERFNKYEKRSFTDIMKYAERTEYIGIKLTKEEKQRLEIMAKSKSMNLSQFFRYALNDMLWKAFLENET